MLSPDHIRFALKANLELLRAWCVSCHSTDVAGKKHVYAFQLILEHGVTSQQLHMPRLRGGDKRRHSWWLRYQAMKAFQGIHSIHSSPLASYLSLLAMPTTIWLTFLSLWV